MTSDFLRQQHEEQRLRHAVEYVAEATKSAKKLTTSELARLNQIITAGDDTAWRLEPVEIQIPSGKVQKFSLISNPIDEARRILGKAADMASNGEAEEAVAYLYSQLVEEHLFQDANRRTAALAVQWILNQCDLEIDTLELLKIPVGDVRDSEERKMLGERVKALIRR